MSIDITLVFTKAYCVKLAKLIRKIFVNIYINVSSILSTSLILFVFSILFTLFILTTLSIVLLSTLSIVLLSTLSTLSFVKKKKQKIKAHIKVSTKIKDIQVILVRIDEHIKTRYIKRTIRIF